VENKPPEVPLDHDLGELVRGHRVVLRGLTLNRVKYFPRYLMKLKEERDSTIHLVTGPSVTSTVIDLEALSDEDRELVPAPNSGDELYFDYVPGIVRDEHVEYWWLKVSDDIGTVYFDEGTLDGFDGGGGGGVSLAGGASSDATRDIGRLIPEEASILKLEFRPAAYWSPPGPWIRELSIDLNPQRNQLDSSNSAFGDS
jgi:hypothetical protein